MDLNKIAEELFAKIRGRFPGVTIGDEEGNVTTEPAEARYFEFPFIESKDSKEKTKVSISLDDEDGVTVMYNSAVAGDEMSKTKWYSFLRELRTFSKKRMLNFDVRNITKSNLEKRDYKYLAKNSGDDSMNESKLYGTSKLSYQDVDGARIVIKHNESVNPDIPTGRTRNIGTIYIESPEGERFKYPFKHLAGARAMARHVAEGGTTYDDFGNHIVELSEEMSKLRKFKNYMSRSSVMAESLADYMGVVHERIGTVKKRIDSLQKKNYYQEAFDSFEKSVFEDIPDDVQENWIDQLTIRQFNEELKDVFPYIYKLVGEATRAKELGPDDFVNEECDDDEDIEEGPLDKLGRSLKVKTTTGNPKITDAPEWAYFIGRTPEGAWHWLEKESEVETDYSDEYFPDAGKTEFTGFISPNKNKEKVVSIRNSKTVDEGPLDKAGRKFNKAMSWGNVSPEEMKKKVRNMSDDELKTLAKRAGEKDGGSGSERGLQMKLINQELKRRYGVKPGKSKDPIEAMFNELMGQWAEDENEACCDGCEAGTGCERDEAPEAEEPEGEQQSPLSEFILSFYDRTNGSFPKGETAVLTMVEKDYGEQFIEPAKQFIENINSTFEQFQARQTQQAPVESGAEDFERIRSLAGL